MSQLVRGSFTAAIFTVLFIFSLSVFAQEQVQDSELQTLLTSGEIDELREETRKLERLVDELRRDQLNYKIEKDLLRDAYSSNLETVNTVTTLVLALLTILGFLGVRGIFSLRTEFRDELKAFGNLTNEAKVRLDEIERSHKDFSNQISRLDEVNEMQNARISTMELHDQASTAFEKNDFLRTVELMNSALEANPHDVVALNQKALALFKLNKFAEACGVLTKALEIDPDNTSASSNLLEGLICAGRIGDFDAVLERHRFDVAKTDHLEPYLLALRLFSANDSGGLFGHILEHLGKLPDPDETEIFLDWTFDDIRRATKSAYGTNIRKALMTYTEVLAGDLSPAAGIERVKELQRG